MVEKTVFFHGKNWTGKKFLPAKNRFLPEYIFIKILFTSLVVVFTSSGAPELDTVATASEILTK